MSVSRPASVCIPIPDVASLAAPGVDTNKVLADWAKSLTSTLEDLVRKSMTNSRYAASQKGPLRVTPEGVVIGDEEGEAFLKDRNVDDLLTTGKIQSKDRIFAGVLSGGDEGHQNGAEMTTNNLSGTTHGVFKSVVSGNSVEIGIGDRAINPDDQDCDTMQLYFKTDPGNAHASLYIRTKESDGHKMDVCLVASAD